MLVANMATFPARGSVIQETVGIIANQVDILNLCLNEYSEVPAWCLKFKNLNAVVPDQDWKDVGKFIFEVSAEDDVLLVDDDIVYPRDYVKHLIACRDYLNVDDVVLGSHAIIYSDFFDGMAHSRNVKSFRMGQDRFRQVNQLGTGTVLVAGRNMPTLDYMIGSQKFVDVRFSRFLHEKRIPLVSIPRAAGWMQDRDGAGEGIFEGFTSSWPDEVISEVMDIAGYSKIDIEFMAYLKTLSFERVGAL
jgi:hypothetical protein